ncbi:MAG TPA: hypothetical protein VG055_23075 [Planctomycetaceae bacterium]|jgi:hypothetical protein|nr:hypothetical protein [Planctomycetaceae bacterium]
MAKRKKSSKKSAAAPTPHVITVTVPKEWEAYDKAIIQGIIEATLGKGPKFGITKVIVQAAAAPGEAAVPASGAPVWDKLC